MKEDICSIPINDIFSKGDGCPICRIFELLEKNAVEALLGAAKMEPEIRRLTNEKGFCPHHLEALMATKRKFQLALILETHLAEYKKASPRELTAFAAKHADECYICERVDFNFQRLLRNMFVLFETEPEFRERFAASPTLCFKHAKLCLSSTAKKVIKKNYKAFETAVYDIVNRNVDELCGRLREFCEMYDYKNTEKAGLNNAAQSSVDHAVEFLK